MERTCKKCGILKPLEQFRAVEKWHHKTCKECQTRKEKERIQKDPERQKEVRKIYYEKNKKEILVKAKFSYLDNKDKILPLVKERQKTEKYKKKRRANRKDRTEKDPLYKLRKGCSIRIWHFLKGAGKSKPTKDLIGCSWDQLKKHLEEQFKDGMSWENWSKTGWHIDHIIPLSSANTLEEIERLCHYTNLQPLWAEDNLKKGAKL